MQKENVTPNKVLGHDKNVAASILHVDKQLELLS